MYQACTVPLTAPLDSTWDEQICYLWITLPGEGQVTATCDGTEIPCQATGRSDVRGREVVVRLGFARGQQRELLFTATTMARQSAVEVPFTEGVLIGDPALPVSLAAPPTAGSAGPFSASAITPWNPVSPVAMSG